MGSTDSLVYPNWYRKTLTTRPPKREPNKPPSIINATCIETFFLRSDLFEYLWTKGFNKTTSIPKKKCEAM